MPRSSVENPAKCFLRMAKPTWLVIPLVIYEGRIASLDGVSVHQSSVAECFWTIESGNLVGPNLAH